MNHELVNDESVRDTDGVLSLRKLLHLMVEKEGTDLHIKVGSPPGVRIHGQIHPIGRIRLVPKDAERLVKEILTDDQFERFEESGDLDIAYSVGGVSRYRVNVLRQRGSMGLAIRRIPESVPTLDELKLSPACKALAQKTRGLVLVTGPTGCGKSTTLAAMVDYINSTRSCHIVTMEDPIEYVHTDRLSYVTQREIGRDTRDFQTALHRALRQDPDVIMIGELRDLETIALAVTAAETGHLVFATLHTSSAVQTIARIIDVFPHEAQQQIRIQLADTLEGVLCQSMLPKNGGGCVIAQEVLIAVGPVRALIREAKTQQIQNIMQTGSQFGMRTLESELNDLLAADVISLNTALTKANHPRLISTPRTRTDRAVVRSR
ncbi:MAG: type IV pilus twitching motility protein PilT [Planctomycetota bacterium]